jgi:hypothetical protein
MPNQSVPFNSNLYSIPGVYFDADDTGNGSQTAEDPTPNGSGNTGPSQEELNRQFTDRAKRAAEAERKRLFESLGVQDEASLKAIIDAKKQADDAAKTELQKLADKATAAEAEKTRLQAEADQRLNELQTRILNSEIKLAASAPVNDKEGKVTRSPFRPESMDAVIALIERTEIVDKEGKYEGIDKALDKLAKAHPYMLAEAQQADPKGTPGGKSRKINPDDKETGNRLAGIEFTSL